MDLHLLQLHRPPFVGSYTQLNTHTHVHTNNYTHGIHVPLNMHAEVLPCPYATLQLVSRSSPPHVLPTVPGTRRASKTYLEMLAEREVSLTGPNTDASLKLMRMAACILRDCG